MHYMEYLITKFASEDLESHEMAHQINVEHLPNTVFNGMLIYVTLYTGIELQPTDSFYPFNGVKELYESEYTWTRGRALVYLTGNHEPTPVSPCPPLHF